MQKHFIFFLLFLQCIAVPAYSYNLRRISNRDGLSNSAVTCLFQDNKRFLWIGTYDGLNMYDGRDIRVYKPDINNRNSLSSNVVRNILETDSAYLWISTKWGLNKLSQRTNAIEESYNEFGENSYMVKDSRDNLYILGKPDVLSCYSKERKAFTDLPIYKGIDHQTVRGMVMDAHDTLWINHRGVMERYTVETHAGGSLQISRHGDFPHPHPVRYAFRCDERMVLVDAAGDIYCVTSRGTPQWVRNLKELIEESGEIGSILFDNDDLLIGFKTNGLIRLDASRGYEAERIDINCGVFSLWKDPRQDIIWIGTDGQGVYAYTQEEYTFHNLLLSQLPVNKRRPVRAIYADHQGTLWLGTKDNGIIRIRHYDRAEEAPAANVTHFTTHHGLSNNAVFAFAPDLTRPILWIGSDGPGLDYYSFRDNRIHSLVNPTRTGIARVHSITQTADSLLWLGSGSTLLRISLAESPRGMEARDIRSYRFDVPNRQQYNQIYALYPENDSILWIGMRGNGVIRMNMQTETHRLISFDSDGIAPMNDILCLHQDRQGNIWAGSSYGLTRFRLLADGSYAYRNFNENEGLPNNTIHGITEDPEGNLWLSSNTGIILFNPAQNTFRLLNHKTGLKEIEFSDNAYFCDAAQERYFFGGVDGVVWIENEEKQTKEFVPGLYFTKLRIFNREYNLAEFMEKEKEKEAIVLKHDRNFFAVSFVATDFINGENCKYSYMLENFSDVWMDTHSNEAQFTNIPPGKYVLHVKYDDGQNSNGKLVRSLGITILPPWYLTTAARLLYIFISLGACAAAYFYIRRKYERRKASIARRLQEKYKEEMYEGKLRFFTNITHEFCTPLTLIYGPCERLLKYEKSDSFIRKYTQIIRSNTERLNSLIQEVIDFRRIETGHRTCHIRRLNVSELAAGIIDSFGELAEQNRIRLKTVITPDILWNTDHSGFVKIMSNLISNAFKYTPEQGTVRISLEEENGRLKLKVYNTGKGIAREDIPLIFNRYSVLDNIRENSIKGLSSRNGLGLAICHSLVELLEGNIEVDSEVDRYAEFTVTLPPLEVTDDNECPSHELPPTEPAALLPEARPVIPTPPAAEEDGSKATILVIDDNRELLWMLKDILSDEYTVLTAENGEDGLALLKQETPEAIITDIMMPKVDGITLTKQIKNNRHTVHIPLIILSARNTTDEKIEGIESGADAYIPKPFQASYLKTVVRQLIKKRHELKQYYNTSASAYDFSGGQLLPVEDKQFLQAAVEAIDAHLDNPNFGPEELAESLQTSSRNLYRKLKLLNQPSPNDFIKDRRLHLAAKLLRTTTLTVQEIMYRTSFTNRSHFYREFAKRYNQAPREYREAHKEKDDSLG